MIKRKPIYVLGTGLSHDGSACLLKDGKIAYAIEKERITRRKHDGLNDSDAIKYCLDAEGISIHDVDLVVQNANFGSFEYGNDYFYGERIFKTAVDVPVVTISHHLAHAYNALGTCPYKETSVLILDGCGSLYDECIDIKGCRVPEIIDNKLGHLYAEKDSFYVYKNNRLSPIYKDFSPSGMYMKEYPMHPPTTMHSIGGMYHAASHYCFGNMDDVGKLMGLAPYGKPGVFHGEVFEMKEGRIFVNYEWMKSFRNPARSYQGFYKNFQYYADIAYWIQKEAEKAILYIIKSRSELTDSLNIAYSGGVALNAVANAQIRSNTKFKNLYITPAAGDNGLSIGCAYYGWLEILKKERVLHNGNSCFGISYSNKLIKEEIETFTAINQNNIRKAIPQIIKGLPSFFRKKGITTLVGKQMQLIISDVGIYSIIFSQKSKVVTGPCQKPDCILTIGAKDFIRCMKDGHYLSVCLSTGKAQVSNLSVLQAFAQILDGKKMFNSRIAKAGTPKNFSVQNMERNSLQKRTANLLAEGKIIGWFQNGCEFGPRALGHRSILADPRRVDIQNFINAKIKFREDFRPFAPSVISEDASDYFEIDYPSPYMIMVAPVKPEWRDKIPGVVHRDGSCRIQTVTPEWNDKFYDLLLEFKKITGVSVLLNTSFNRRGMPIVETPTEAINFLFESGLDCVVVGDYIVSKRIQ